MRNITRSDSTDKNSFYGSIWVGVDVHKKIYSVAILAEEDRHKQFTKVADPASLGKN